MEQNISLSSIVRDPSLQVRERLDNDWVTELTDLYRGQHEIAAVEVVFDGEKYLLTDGWHRCEAQCRAWGGDAVVAAEVIDASHMDDPVSIAKTRAAMGNRAGGLRRTDGDKRKAVMLIRSTPAGRKMTHDEIAKRVGVSRSRVTQILSAETDVSANTPSTVVNYGGAPRPSVGALWSQIDAALQADPGKPDLHIAKEIGCQDRTVRERRAALGLQKSDPTRWKPSGRDAVVAELKRDADQPNRVVAEKTGAAPETVSKIRDELGLPARKRGPSKPSASLPSAPVNPKRTDDPREQGAEVLPSRPPPSRKPDVVTEFMQRFERADRLDQQTIATALYKRWPHYFMNAIEEGREERPVLQ